MIVDAFPYAGEADILECRLTELDSVVDRFVIAEADYTHGGAVPKPYHFERQTDRFAQWLPKIKYVKVGLSPTGNAWSRETQQRECLTIGLVDLDPTDTILLSDVDEIPNVSAVHHAKKVGGPCVLRQRGHYLAIDWEHPDAWLGTVSAPKSYIKTLNQLRNRRHAYSFIPGAGWHISWLGGIEAVQDKFAHWCHSELPTNLWDIRRGIHVDGMQMYATEVNSTYPKWVQTSAPGEWFRSFYDQESRPQLQSQGG